MRPGLTPRAKRRGVGRELWAWGLRVAALAALVASARFVATRATGTLAGDAPSPAADLLSRMFPPDWDYAPAIAAPLVDTLHIATLGTLLAIAVGAPLSLLAAKNTAPLRPLRLIALVAIAASRSINSLVWALLLVAILGPGMLAGVLAIALRSIGFVAKLLYEAVEEIDPEPVEAVLATGASRPQVVAYGVAPQTLPALAGISAFRWEINVREATIVGLVGAGGIGLQLHAAVEALEWPRVAVILIAVLALVAAAEWASARVRRLWT